MLDQQGPLDKNLQRLLPPKLAAELSPAALSLVTRADIGQTAEVPGGCFAVSAGEAAWLLHSPEAMLSTR